ncbi:hypothetical protein V8F06_014634 [Rhypophila decipiens]
MSSGGRTSYADNSCQLIGEGDLYGVGVRVSYYLFFFATLIAILSKTLSPSQTTRKTGPIGRCAEAINILTFAILVVIIRNTRNGSFATLEWFLTYPTILVTFISLCFALLVWNNAGILLCYGVTLCLLTVCQPWLYWRRMYQGSKPECEVRYWFFGERNFFGQVWVTFFSVMSVVACIGGIALFFVAVDHAFAKKIVDLRVLSGSSLDSTSQLIPFLTGLLSFLSTLYSCTPFSSTVRRLVFGNDSSSVVSLASEREELVQ